MYKQWRINHKEQDNNQKYMWGSTKRLLTALLRELHTILGKEKIR